LLDFIAFQQLFKTENIIYENNVDKRNCTCKEDTPEKGRILATLFAVHAYM